MANITKFIAHRREFDLAVQTVDEHLIGVAELGSACAQKIGMKPHGSLVGLLHDLGKYSAGFQRYFDDHILATEKVDHSTAGAQFLWNQLSQRSDIEAAMAQMLALCIASHHGGLIDCLTPEGEDRFLARMQKDDSLTHLDEVLAKVDRGILERCQRALADPLLVGDFEAAMKAIHRQEASVGQAGKETRFRFAGGLLLRMLFSCLIDADRTDTADFEHPHKRALRALGKYVSWEILIDRLERHLGSFEDRSPIDPVRRRISDECRQASERPKGFFTLTVPTGGGKSLASLRFALHHAKRWRQDRIIYVVPYTTIIDQNAQDAREILEPHNEHGGFASVVLEHHSNLTSDEETPRSKILSENWDAPVVYTTMVQLLESLFGAGTRNVRRMHQLTNAVIIFDEIQTLPVKTVHLFCNAINFLVEQCGSTVVLCTATQPLLNEVDKNKGAARFDDRSEIAADVHQLFRELKRVDVVDSRKVGGWEHEEIAGLAWESVRESGSCLVIVNTKVAARSIYRECKVRQKDSVICHLSTSMCPAHRMSILGQIGKRLGKKGKPPEEPGPLLCISTQLIEAGVDIDFGSVVRFVAGLDSIAQAAGRCNRHGRQTKGILTIVNPQEENLEKLDDIRVGRDVTVRILEEFLDAPDSLGDDILSSKTVERYFHYYFFERKTLMDYPIFGKRDDTLLNMLSVNSNAVGEYVRRNGTAPKSYWRQSFMAAAEAFKAIDAPTRGVIVPYGARGQELIGELCSATSSVELRHLMRAAQKYAVNLFPWELERLGKDGALHEVQRGTSILHLDARFYNEEFGLDLDGLSQQPFLSA
jgi:CRISPR-associated endonuclease/helicase Cas3